MKNHHVLCLIAAAFFTLLQPALAASVAASVTAEAVAAPDAGGMDIARQSAIQDALATPQKNLSPPYKKKIVATPFTVYKHLPLEDIDDIASGFPRELLRRLETSKKYLPRISKFTLSVEPWALTPTAASVKQIAEMHDSQLVLSGEIVDAGSRLEGDYFGYFGTKKRNFEVEIYLHDGITGALIARHRVNQSTTGELFVGRDKPFGSTAFFSTNYGKVVEAVMNSALEVLQAELDALPFSARIVQVKGDKIYLNAGATSAIASGDTLVVYRLKNELPVTGLVHATEYGATEVPLATLTINQVQPLFSVGVLSQPVSGVKIKAGDFIRLETFK